MGKDYELLDACRNGNITAVEKLLSAKLAHKGKGTKGSGSTGAFSLIKSLSSLKGVNVHCVDTSGYTPLHLAALNGHLDIVKLLLECDASATILDTQDCSSLHLAAWSGHFDICSHLLKSSDGPALLNQQTRDGNTALHFAAQHGHNNVLSLLLQNQANPTIRNLEDKCPLDLAAQYDRLDIVGQLVISHPELVAQRSAVNTPLHLASRLGHHAVVKCLLDAGFPIDAKTDKGTALHEAANFCKLDVFKLLLERGININVQSQSKYTAEDILRSIPSKAAEDALNILKTHIYHQRTPDSDGEKSIVGDLDPVCEKPTSPVNKRTSSTSDNSSNVLPVASPKLDKKTGLFKSLPATSEDGSTPPPPIPPRLSCRIVDRSEGPVESANLLHLNVPYKPDANTLPTPPSDSTNEDNSSRHSSVSRDLSPSSRSPTDLPKKPPRKKPLSFRRQDQGPPLTLPVEPTANDAAGCTSSAGVNYVNFDPEIERARLDGDARADQHLHTATEASTAYGHSETSEECASKQHPELLNPRELQPNEAAIIESGTSPPTSLQLSNSQPADTGTATSIIANTDTSQGVSSPDTYAKRYRPQPPTPDCPPPSPGTALSNIQKQILPTDKRRSKDMETITDSSLTEGDMEDPVVVRHHQHNQNQQQADVQDSVFAPATLPRSSYKKKPLPLPRKSSLSSDSRSISARASLPLSDDVTVLSSSPKSLDGYEGAMPVSRKSNLESKNSNADAVESTSASSDGEKERRLSSSSGQNEGKLDGGPCENIGEPYKTDVVVEEDDAVQMRRSVSAENKPEDVFAGFAPGLLRGSVVGTPREVSRQFSSNASGRIPSARKRQSTLASSGTNASRSTFAPVMEEDRDLDANQLFKDIDNIDLNRRTKEDTKGVETDDVFDDFSDDWDQISATFETIGVGLSRESVFVRDHEDNFAKFLTEKKKGEGKFQSVGSWLSDIGLSQYENTLVANGFDDTDFLGGPILEDSDLEHIGVSDSDHRHAIIDAAQRLPAVVSIDPDNLPSTVAEWLDSLRLDYYFDTFMSHKFDSMNRVVQLWELELVTVLDITSVGHRKRILASLGERRPDNNISPARSRIPSYDSPSRSPFEHVDLYRDYTGARSRVSNDNDLDPSSVKDTSLENDSSSNGSTIAGRSIKDEALHLRAPHLMHDTGIVKQWRHKPEILIKGCCNYTAHYLGSTLVKELKGAMSTQEGIAKLKKSSAVISKIPTIMLSISFKGVKFIDASSKKVVCDHEIANIFCACQDGEHMNFFAYITKDKQACLHYCHVFSVRSKELAGEIILTLGEAFEIAYQMALKERAEREAQKFDQGCSVSEDAVSLSNVVPSSTTA